MFYLGIRFYNRLILLILGVYFIEENIIDIDLSKYKHIVWYDGDLNPIIISNHVSVVDPLLLLNLANIVLMSKSEIFKFPVAGEFLKRTGSISVNWEKYGN